MVRDFIDRGQPDPCHSHWAAPCFIVPEKVAGDWRLVVDYCGVNVQTPHHSYLLPLIVDMLQKTFQRRICTGWI